MICMGLGGWFGDLSFWDFRILGFGILFLGGRGGGGGGFGVWDRGCGFAGVRGWDGLGWVSKRLARLAPILTTCYCLRAP